MFRHLALSFYILEVKDNFCLWSRNLISENISQYCTLPVLSLSPLNTHADCQTDEYVDACIPIKLAFFFKPCLELYSLIFRVDFRHICYPHPLLWRPTQAPALVTHTTYHPQCLRLKTSSFFWWYLCFREAGILRENSISGFVWRLFSTNK